MNITLKYGYGEHSFGIPDTAEVSIFRPKPTTILDSLGEATEHALDKPVGCDRFVDLVRKKAPKRIPQRVSGTKAQCLSCRTCQIWGQQAVVLSPFFATVCRSKGIKCSCPKTASYSTHKKL